MWKILTAVVVLLSVAHAEPSAGSSRTKARRHSASIDSCWDLVVKTPFLHPNRRGRFFFIAEGDSLVGTVILHDEGSGVREGTIDGETIRFGTERDGDKLLFEGEVHGTELRGSLIKLGKRFSWIATRCDLGE